jgi:haloalkane dehalogenase
VESVENEVEMFDRRFYVRDHPGAEPAIILMHGFPDNVHLYDRVSLPLAAAPGRAI